LLKLYHGLSGCTLDWLGFLGHHPSCEPIWVLCCSAPPIDAHGSSEVIDRITYLLLIHNTKGMTSGSGQHGYKVSKVDFGGPIANNGIRHLVSWGVEARKKVVMCGVRAKLPT
jgi:hypothetical protein